MTSACSPSAGSSSRNRHTPLKSARLDESLRSFHSALRLAGFGFVSFQDGYVISSKSPQCAQRKSWLAASLKYPQAIQRNRKFLRVAPATGLETEDMDAIYCSPRRY